MLEAKYKSFYDELRRGGIDRKRLITDPLRLFALGTDASFYRLIPKLIVRATTTEEIQKILAAATRYDVPITFRAAGTALSGQSATDSVLVLTGKDWEGIKIDETGEHVEVQPGIIGARVNQLLAPYGRKLGPDPASVRSAMIGGIVANNASGMNGTDENSYKTIDSVRIVLADGTVLDTGSPASRDEFRQTHPEFLARLEEIRRRVADNEALTARVHKKYSIKNTTGLGLNSLVDYTDPFDVITHLMVGSEGTLAFIDLVRLSTLEAMPCKASAMLYFNDMRTACEAVQQLKGSPVGSVELLDRLAIRSIEHMEGIPTFIHTLPEDGTALLIETTARDKAQLDANIKAINALIHPEQLAAPIEFTDKPEEYSKYWKMRSGVFPSVGAMRQPGTSCLIEDVVFPMEVLPDATIDLQHKIAEYGYEDGVIYGHAIEGNYHFIINEDFSNPSRVNHFDCFLHNIARLVVEKYDGSLKGEHGTGRNIAPYVAYEWGEELWQVMKDLKALFDPNNVLNRGVIFNDDPKCNMKNLKSMSLTNKNVDRCIECGFCEVNCLTCGFTLSARQRISSQREISRLRASGENPELLKAYLKEYRYYGEQTCAGDGLCATSCPVQINTGHLTHDLREAQATPTTNKIAQWTADNFSTITSAMRVGLKGVNGLRVVFGSQLFGAMARGVRAASGGLIPLWTRSMPRGSDGPKQGEVNEANPRKVVYFPSCINQVMGTSAMDSTKEPLHRVMERVMRRAGFEVIYPERMEHLCCGTIWESKGFPKQADEKSAELEAALRKASNDGEYPIVCDQSPCLYRMKSVMKSLKLYEPAEFIVEHCAEHLTFKPVDEQIALHYTCSMRKMGKTDYLMRLAQMCTSGAMVPEEVGCCGFAGDRGFNYPEVNAYALRKLRPQVEAKGIKAGYSNSRTCEIGLATNSGVPYSSIVYLVDRCTE